jgi:hypothetical protein
MARRVPVTQAPGPLARLFKGQVGPRGDGEEIGKNSLHDMAPLGFLLALKIAQRRQRIQSAILSIVKLG